METEVMLDIRSDIAAYEKMRPTLELEHIGKWVLFHDGKLVDLYSSFDDAAKAAVSRFGRGPYLIRQIGAQDITMPASVMYRPAYA